jgi:hypothetical protein
MINRLSAALTVAALLAAPAVARQGQPAARRVVENGIVTAAPGAPGQTGFRAGYSRNPGEFDPWGHWGAYCGPMVQAP